MYTIYLTHMQYVALYSEAVFVNKHDSIHSSTTVIHSIKKSKND